MMKLVSLILLLLLLSTSIDGFQYNIKHQRIIGNVRISSLSLSNRLYMINKPSSSSSSSLPTTTTTTTTTTTSLSLSSTATIVNDEKRKRNKTIKKLVPLGLMFFCILFNYTILRDTKDVLVVTSAGAEIIPFLKTYVQLPSAILFTILYSSMSNKLSQAQVFYAVLLPFLAFFASFAGIIYPNRLLLHPNGLADVLQGTLPTFFTPLVSIFRNWTFSLFYCLAELWGSIVVSVLFWGFANDVTTVDEAKKYYPLFGLGANVALIFSGRYVNIVSKIRASLPAHVDKWGYSLKLLMGAVCGMGAIIGLLFYYMQTKVLTDPECVSQKREEKRKKTKTKMTIGESAKFLSNSPYIRNLALLVICYGMSINIVEVTWKSKLKAAFPDPNDYSAFMGNFSSATGLVTLFLMIAGRWIFKVFGWNGAALITPITLLVTGATFFSLILFPGFFAPITAKLGTTPLMLAVLVGALQNILSKGSKYSLFDPCKEMAYIPLDSESKTKGKAAVDVIGNPLGKSGGSLIQQILIATTGSLQSSTPYLGVLLGIIVTTWINAAASLNKQFIVKSKEMDEQLAKENN